MPISRLSLGSTWEAPKGMDGVLPPPGARISRQTESWFHARQEQAQHRAAPTGEGSERGVDAGERSPASLPAIAALLQYTLWEAPGQQVSSLISKKCSYLSALGSPNYTLPASSEGCGAAFNSDRREQTELCRTGGNKLICSRQHLPVAMLSSH